MLAKTPRHAHNAFRGTRQHGSSFLPFLYCTKTIQRHYTSDKRDPSLPKSSSDALRKRPILRSVHEKPRKAGRRTQDELRGRPEEKEWHQPEHDQRLNEVNEALREDEALPKARVWRPPDIPFERGPRIDPYADLEGSTITPTEKKAFEGLFKLQKASSTQSDKAGKEQAGRDGKKKAGKGGKKLGIEQRGSRDDLDTILTEAEANVNARRGPKPEFPKALQPLADRAREQMVVGETEHWTMREQEEMKSREPSQADAIERAAKADRRSMTKILAQAQTDVEVWQALQERVLNRVAAATNDSSAITTEEKPPFSTLPEGITDLQILTVNLPTHIIRIFRLFRDDFPASPLALAILPTLKGLGPRAFALGASIALYNSHMRMLFIRYPLSLHHIIDVLEEMDREVYAFDHQTSGLLATILTHAAKATRGEMGEGVKAVWSTERMRKSVSGIYHWMRVVQDRREAEVLRKARAEDETRVGDLRWREHIARDPA